jgi:hypothetical protein
VKGAHFYICPSAPCMTWKMVALEYWYSLWVEQGGGACPPVECAVTQPAECLTQVKVQRRLGRSSTTAAHRSVCSGIVLKTSETSVVL